MVELAEEMMAAFDGQYPNLVEFTVGHVMQPGYRFGAEFDFGLELILDGLSAHVA